MVFVSIGTQDKKFDRLITYLKKLKEENILKEDLVIQSGITEVDFGYDDNYNVNDNNKNNNSNSNSNYNKYNVSSFDYITVEEMEKYIQEANYVIIHGGVGTIIQCIMENKKTIVVPRLEKNGEHENDHQLEIANKFKELNYIAVANNYEELKDIICNIQNISFDRYIPTNEEFVEKLEEIIKDM